MKEEADRRLSKDDRRRASLDALPARTLHQDMDVLYREEGGYVSRFSQCLLSVLTRLGSYTQFKYQCLCFRLARLAKHSNL